MQDSHQQCRLKPEQLYKRCDTRLLDFTSTEDLEPLSESVGQERALEAISFGVGMPYDGFNLYAMGSDGLGRHTLVQHALETLSHDNAEIFDWCYVYNFQQPHIPVYLKLPAGLANELRNDLTQLIMDLVNAMPTAFQSDEYLRRSKVITDTFKKKEDQASSEVGEKAEHIGIALVRDATGLALLPLKKGKVLTTDEFHQLSEEELEKIEASMEVIKAELKATMGQVSKWQREMQKAFRELDRETSKLIVSQFVDELQKKYHDLPDVLNYLSELEQDIVDNIDRFRNVDEAENDIDAQDARFTPYQVNILVNNSRADKPPIIFEDNPTHQNLIGRVEHIAQFGTLKTNFMLIKPGALHKANGGFLILDAEKTLTNPYAWDSLKRAIRSNEIRIESLERQLGFGSTVSLEPQPIPTSLKVILVGSRVLFYLLKTYDPEFSLLFKVTTDFAEEFSRDGESELLYARLIATLQFREKLRPLSNDGVARIIEQCSRFSDDSEKLSLHMGHLISLLQESDYWARQNDSNLITSEHVQHAIDAQARRVNQIQEQIREEMLRGTLKVETSGVQLAQVNGLSVMRLGDYSFGVPSVISATARMGNGDFIDIERESSQGGAIHSKGVLILMSYLAERYAKHIPLSVSASIVFEQTYGGVDGDSASAAEVCALLSAIGSVPIQQSLAITGSVNQHGQVQAIGGVCQKIEGFFDLCLSRGLTGKQGVIIPASNRKDLMLRDDVVRAVSDGQFSIFAIDHIDQALELLTGLPAGMPNKEGVYPEGSMNYAVQLQLANWVALHQHYAGQVIHEA